MYVWQNGLVQPPCFGLLRPGADEWGLGLNLGLGGVNGACDVLSHALKCYRG